MGDNIPLKSLKLLFKVIHKYENDLDLHKLVISNVTMNDAGEYKCQVENTNPKLEQVISKIIKCQCIHYTYPKLVFFLQFLGGFVGSKNISFYISQTRNKPD